MPGPRPRVSRPATQFCRYEDPQGRRCRRIATVEGGFCRQCAITLRLDLGQSPLGRVVGALDREIMRSRDPMVRAFGDLLSEFLRSPAQPPPQQRRAPGPGPRPSSPPRQPPPPPRRPPPDPTIEARRILGFDPTQKLTPELIAARKKALARLFHPDVEGGSVDAMARVNNAADVLLAKLS